jgi:hypothetical protein
LGGQEVLAAKNTEAHKESARPAPNVVQWFHGKDGEESDKRTYTMTDVERQLVEKCWDYVMGSVLQSEDLAYQCAKDGTSVILHGLVREFLNIWKGVTDDEKWHDVYFHGEEALFYYLGALRENGSLPKEFIPRWVFVAFAVRDAILHGAGDVEFVEGPVMYLRSASKEYLWPKAIQEIDNCLGWFGTSPA